MNSSSIPALAARLQRRGIFYGWVIVFVSFLVLCLAFGIRLSFSVFFEVLTRTSEFAWSRGETAGVFSLSMLVFALTGAPVGWLLDRLGARMVFVIGILIMTSGLVLTSQMTSLLHFYLFYGIWTGVGITILGITIHGAVISRWFEREGRRGLAIGFAFAGTGIGILALAPAVERIITLTNWRVAYLCLATLLLLVALPLTLFLLRDDPAQLGLCPDGATRCAANLPTPADTQTAQPAFAGWTWRNAAGTPIFWLIMLGGMFSLFSLRLTTVHQVAYFVDHGIPRLTAATIFGSSGLITALAFIGFGSLSDRIGRERAFYLGTLAQIAALGLLIGLRTGTPLSLLYLYALLWGIGEGSRSGLLTAIASDAFPGPAPGAIAGTLGAFFGLGAALGSWLGGAVYDRSGSYVPAFKVALGATILAAGSIFVARRLRGMQDGKEITKHV